MQTANRPYRSIFNRTAYLLLGLCSCALQAQVVVDIAISEPQHHLAQVTLTLPESTDDSVVLQLPTWRTGRYEILNLANGIRLFSAKDETGHELAWQKTDKSSWQITGTKHHQIKVSYQVYANQLGYRTRHIDDSHAFLDASAVVMYNEQLRPEEYRVNLQVPTAWQSASGLRPGSQPHQFIADNYDVLVDSPIETGIEQQRNFTVDSRDYALVVWGEGNYDIDKMVKDLAVMVKQAGNIWTDYPFSRYVFMVHATGGEGGATEHLNSTIMQRSRYKFHERKDYLGFLMTAAHEFVHTWNVKQYRPEGLSPYNYQSENYTTLLWVSEGSTSYLEAQLLLPAQLMTSQEWFKELAKGIDGYQHKPGRQMQSVAESSFDHWLEQGGDYDNNYSVNIYSEGFLVSWLLDFDILKETQGKKSYRDIHRALYQDYRLPHAFSESDMLQVLQQQTGKDYQQWWQHNVHGHPTPNFADLLATVGLEMYYGKDNKQQSWTGLKTKDNSQGVTVTAVEKDSPAWQAGLSVGDIIVAVDGLRVHGSDLKARTADFAPEQSVSFSYFRRDQLASTKLVMGSLPKEKLVVRPMKEATEQQKMLFKAWTGLDFPVEPEKD